MKKGYPRSGCFPLGFAGTVLACFVLAVAIVYWYIVLPVLIGVCLMLGIGLAVKALMYDRDDDEEEEPPEPPARYSDRR